MTNETIETGGVLNLHYYRNRYYAPSLGIFTSRDAMWADWHRAWGYVGNGPTMYVDPYGLMGYMPEPGDLNGNGVPDHREITGDADDDGLPPSDTGVYIGLRPISFFGRYWPQCGAPNHAYIAIPGRGDDGGMWTAGLGKDDEENTRWNVPDASADQPNSKLVPTDPADEGTLPDGTPCSEATNKQIQDCLVNFVKTDDPPSFNPVCDSCQTSVMRAMTACCIAQEIPGCAGDEITRDEWDNFWDSLFQGLSSGPLLLPY